MRNLFFSPGRAVSAATAALALAVVLASAQALHAQATQAPAKPVAPKPAATAPKPAAAGLPAETQDLPPARSIIDKYIRAIGGRQAILSHSSSHATGTMTMAGAGISGGFEVYNAKPNKSLLKVTLPGLGEILEGFDGVHGWTMNPMMGPSLAEGVELEQKKFDADFYGDLHDPSRYTSMRTVEKTIFEARPCYKVSLVKKIGGEDFDFYDAETGLKLGAIGTRETPMGAMTATMIQSDYKKFGGMLVPTTMKQTVAGVEQLITISSMDFDNVPPSTFDMPEKIKALVK